VTTRRNLLGALLPATVGLVPAAPSAGFALPVLDELFATLRQDPHGDLRGVRVLCQGQVVAEAYYNDGRPDLLHDIRSAGKSVTALLAGIAIDQKRIADAGVPISRLLGPSPHPRHAAISLEHLLTMRSGLSADDDDPRSPGNENRLDDAPSWLDFALGVPVREKPGQTYLYCSLNAFLAGACVENATGQPLDEFARQHLFAPLGIHQFTWRRGPHQRVAGQGNLRLTLSAMATLGQLCLDEGRAGTAQLVSAQWIRRSLSSLVSISHADPFADFYGYMWYAKTHEAAGRPVRVSFASGNGGNKIYVIPELRTVVAIASAAYGRPYGQRRSQQILRGVLGAWRPAPGV
jgi:CubicO group peptidase (beta-lactamase class C family)